jgi:hypothetical protein
MPITIFGEREEFAEHNVDGLALLIVAGND